MKYQKIAGQIFDFFWQWCLLWVNRILPTLLLPGFNILNDEFCFILRGFNSFMINIFASFAQIRFHGHKTKITAFLHKIFIWCTVSLLFKKKNTLKIANIMVIFFLLSIFIIQIFFSDILSGLNFADGNLGYFARSLPQKPWNIIRAKWMQLRYTLNGLN